VRIARLCRTRTSLGVVADHVRVLAAVDGLAVRVRRRVPVVGVPVLARSGAGLPARRPAPLVAAPASGAAWTGWATRAGWADEAVRARIANRTALLPVRRWIAGGYRRTLAGAGLARLTVPSVRPRRLLRVIGGRLSWPAELTGLALRTIRTWRPLHAVRARLALRAELARRPLSVKRTRLSLRFKRTRLSLRAEVTGLALPAVRTGRPLHAVRTWLALGTVRARLPRPTVTAWPGETAGGGVSRCRRVAGNRAISWRGPGGSARPRKSSRPEAAGCRSTGSRSAWYWPVRAGETALARERARTGKRAISRGTPLTWECAINGEVSGARERHVGRVRVLGRARSVTVRRTIAWSAADRAAGGPAGAIGLAALGRNDQAAWCVDGGRGQDPFPIGVDVRNRPGAAIRDVAAGKRTLTLVRGGRARPVHWTRSGRCEVTGRTVLTRRSVLTGRSVLRRAGLSAWHRLPRRDARTELTRLDELSRWCELSRWDELSRGHRSAIGRPRAGHELPRRQRPGRKGTRSALWLADGHGSARA
jgi:hypothetical protein